MSNVPNMLTWVEHDCGHEALAHLCDVRGLPRRKRSEQMQKQLARSYRGDREALIEELRKKDLVAILGSEQGIYVDSRWYRLVNAGSHSLDELQAAMRAALIDGDTSEFVRGVSDEDDDDDDDGDDDDGSDDYDDEDGEGADEDGDDDPARAADDDADDGLDFFRERLAALSGRRTISIRSLLQKAELGDFDRLRTERFQELRRMVERAGFLVCDANGAPYGAADETPGIDARVLVPLRAEDEADAKIVEATTDSDVESSETLDATGGGQHGAAALEALASAGSCRLRQLLVALRLGDLTRLKTSRFSSVLEDLGDRGYEVVAPDGTVLRPGAASPGIDARVKLKRRATATSISFVGSDRPPSPPVLSHLSDYELAVARLKILTGVSWLARRNAPSWPAQFLLFATNSVSLDESQRHLLSLFAEKYVTGVHDIQQPLSLLRESQDRGRLAALVDAFELLNDAAGDDVPKVAAQMRARLGLSSNVPTVAAVIERAEARFDPQVQPRAAASGSESVNVRDLGALKGIFD